MIGKKRRSGNLPPRWQGMRAGKDGEIEVNPGPETKKTASEDAVFRNQLCCVWRSALACFKAALGLVDHIDTALTTHNAAVTVPVLERAERVLDLHGLSPVLRREPAPGLAGVPIRGSKQ
jgi:hypothetical protein